MSMRPFLTAALPLAALALCAGPARGQIGNIRRAVQRATSGPSPEVARLLARVDSTRARFDRATFLLLQSSYVMESVVATAERRAEIRRELESAGSLEQRTGENRVQLDAQDRTQRLEQATQQRQFEQRQLSQEQANNVSAAAFNAALAALMDAQALDEAQHLIGDAQTAAQNIASDVAQLAYANRLRDAATVQLPAIVNAVPTQTRLASAVVGAARQASATNQAVRVTEATGATAPPRAIDVTAI
jgi:hypothetical protein